MSETEKLLVRILSGTSDTNISFDGSCGLLEKLGFDERIKGSHHIFSKAGLEKILNLQPREGSKAKPYQVKQVRGGILKYRLGGENES
jgi:hypothetical protein